VLHCIVELGGTIPAMDSFKRYIRKYGIPMSIYFDKNTTYKLTADPSEDEINGTEPLSEFGRALTELGVEIIHAHSPLRPKDESRGFLIPFRTG